LTDLSLETAEESVFQDVLEILTSTSSAIEQICKDSCGLGDLDPCLLLVAECFRCLRNACVECAKNQHVLRYSYDSKKISPSDVLLPRILVNVFSGFLSALRCSLQFLGNVAAGNGDSQNSIWKCAFPDLFLTCLAYNDEKIVTYCCMVLFTCLNSERVRELLYPGNLTVALHILRVYKQHLESEWSYVSLHFLFSHILISEFNKLFSASRVTLLELLMVKINDKNSVTSEEVDVFVQHAEFLAGCFQENCGAVLKLTAAADEALVTIRLLDVLCEMTSNNNQLEHLQAFPGLLETAIDTLRLTHLAGKQAVNVFTATHAVTGQEEISHPAVGFKSHLIRLIGNLCYKNKENQDKVYELDGISLILDNCSIDDNNPFVSQWAVFAIRNVTEQNERNQALIAQMEQRGLADSSALQSMGLEIQQRDDKFILQSLRKKRLLSRILATFFKPLISTGLRD
uniref:Ataxin-10 n=1 Tax=Malurus cyaneus samueli TaxID=2593467 RepID=A0A8C5UDM7_9PASS